MTVQNTPTPGVYLDGSCGHYILPLSIAFAQSRGFQIDPFAEYVLDRYADDYHTDAYPTAALDELATEAINYLNRECAVPNAYWDFQDGDFGLFVNEDDNPDPICGDR